MKKYCISIILLCIVLVILTSCGTVVEIRGLNNFSTVDSSVGLCSQLIPEGFLENYPYIRGDYFYKFEEEMIAYNVEDKALMYLEYEEQEYFKAKEHAINSLSSSEEVPWVCNGYYFLKNDKLSEWDFPRHFSHLVYNDEKQILIFFAFSVSTELYDSVVEDSKDFESFLKKYFGEFYDFSD